MDSGPEPNNKILVTNNIDFYEENGFKHFKAARLNKANNSVIVLSSTFDEYYKLISACITIGNVDFDINNSQGEFDLELLQNLIALSTTSMVLDYKNGEFQTFLSRDNAIKPIEFGVSFFKEEALKESNYMYMDDIDRMANYIIACSSSTGYKCPIEPVVFEKLEKDFKAKEKPKIISLEKKVS